MAAGREEKPNAR